MPLHIPMLELDKLEKNIAEARKLGSIAYKDGMIDTGVPSKRCSDGHHTFAELYEHRYLLWIAYCQLMAQTPDIFVKVWRSKLHADGTMFPDSFVLGMNKAAGKQITYHLREALWDLCDFAETLDHAPEYDGHTPMEGLTRIYDQVKGRAK